MSLAGKQLGRYRILRLVGSGGMGEVYLAEDTQVLRQVAAKVIKIEESQTGNAATNNMLRQFLREATAIARLDHPHILPLYDHGEERQDNTHYAYLITPYRSEGSLVNWLSKRSQGEKTQQLMPKQVVHIIQQAASALQYAHDHQVIHQDVKPANFLIRSVSEADEYPDLLLADFGIALLASSTSTSSQVMRGTPVYMAPEQWANQAVFASDQYALAVMAYELLTEKPPFQGNPMSMMYAHLNTQPRPPRELNELLPAAVNDVLLLALAKKPEERFSSISAFANAFQQAFQEMDAGTILRVLQPAPSTPQTPALQSSNDLRVTLAISSEEARSGARRSLTLPGGRKVDIPIPPGALSGQVISLSGLGEASAAGNAGNLYLTLSVVETRAPVFQMDDATALTYRTPQIAQPVTPIPEALAQEVTSPPTIAATQSTVPRQNFHTQVANSNPPGMFVLPPAPPERQAPKKRAGLILLILLLILLLGGGGLGVYYVTTTHQSSTNSTASATTPGSTQQVKNGATVTATVNVTATALANAATATVQAGVNGAAAQATATAQANTPGSHWTLLTPVTTSRLNAVTWSGSQFVAVGNTGTILTSSDGKLWTDRTSTSGTQQNLNAVTWSKSFFVVVGDNDTILTSPDGKTWTAQQPAGLSQNLNGVSGSGSMLVAVGDNGTILLSSDGQNWNPSTSSSISYNLRAIRWSGSQFVTVGYNGRIFTSPDGSTWTDRSLSGSPADLPNLEGVRPGSGYVAVGDNGTIASSSDGKQWSLVQFPTQENLTGVTWSGSQFVAVGSNGIILRSSDRQHWEQADSGTSQGLGGIAWSGTQFVAVGNNGTLLTSP